MLDVHPVLSGRDRAGRDQDTDSKMTNIGFERLTMRSALEDLAQMGDGFFCQPRRTTANKHDEIQSGLPTIYFAWCRVARSWIRSVKWTI